jgi:hypothetical protein
VHGPALISGFVVFDDLMADDKFHCKGFPRGHSRVWGFHTMVLLLAGPSSYKTGGEHLISVTEEHLKAAGSTISFVITPQITIPASFSTHSFRYAEALLLDLQERLLEEREQAL